MFQNLQQISIAMTAKIFDNITVQRKKQRTFCNFLFFAMKLKNSSKNFLTTLFPLCIIRVSKHSLTLATNNSNQ